MFLHLQQKVAIMPGNAGNEKEIEDERRWLLLGDFADRQPFESEVQIKFENIFQFYVSTTIGTQRFRRSEEWRSDGEKTTYTQTFKAPKEYSAGAEHDREIPEWVYEMMLSNSVGQTQKIRSTIVIDGWAYELDYFEGDCSGLVIVELEFKEDKLLSEDENAARYKIYQELDLPDMFGENTEITGSKGFSNYELATQGPPKAFFSN